MRYLIQRCSQWLRLVRLIAVIVMGMAWISGCGGGGGNGSTNGTSPPPGTGESQVDGAPPSPPSNLVAAATSTGINLSWGAATDNVGVTSYKVYRGGTAIATIPSTSHADTGLSANTQYCYDVTAIDAAGNESAHSGPACATTSTLADATPPTVLSTGPANDAADIAVDIAVTAIFSESMDATSLNQATFMLTDASNKSISGTISYSGTTATFTPSEVLAPSAIYKATLAVGVKDTAGNPLANAYSWSFKTGLATYELTAVGVDVPGDDAELFTLANDLNDKGEVTGEVIRRTNVNGTNPSQVSSAFLWRSGALLDLGFLNEAVRESRSQGINDQSEVVGWSQPLADGQPAFHWRDNQMTAIGLEDAYAINNAGQVVGYVNRIEGAEVVSVAVVWQSGQLAELNGVVNPWNINEAGDVVGFSYVAQLPQASLWRAGVVTLLGQLPGALSSQAFDINSGGRIVGSNAFAPPATPTTYQRAFLWQSGSMMELPRLVETHTSSDAYGLNDRDHVVGRSGASQYTATVWFDGAAYDLNELIAADDPLKPYVTLLEAREINNRGQIIAQGTDSRRSGSYTGFLLTPQHARAVSTGAERPN